MLASGEAGFIDHIEVAAARIASELVLASACKKGGWNRVNLL
jgi:hypothetical protein